MASKAVFLLAVLASAAVLATEAEQTYENNDDAGVKDWRGAGVGGGSVGGYGNACHYGCCHHVFHGGCLQCCPPPSGAGRPAEVKN